jgi:hypothetical protein
MKRGNVAVKIFMRPRVADGNNLMNMTAVKTKPLVWHFTPLVENNFPSAREIATLQG